MSLREYLRPMIFANEGLSLFIDVAKDQIKELRGNIQAKRTATKGLVNLALAKQEIRMSVIS